MRPNLHKLLSITDMRILIILISFLLLAACLSEKAQLNRAELHPILKQLNLTASEPLTIKHKEVLAIEEADSKSYQPLLGVTVFIEASSPTRDSEGMKPRYWLRVEDYSTAEAAAEYNSVGTYDRLAKAHPDADGIISKVSVRQWSMGPG